MEHSSFDMLNDFEFHDALFTLSDCGESSLTVDVRHLNIRKGAEQNPFPTAMEIETAKISFLGFCAKAFVTDSSPLQSDHTVSYADTAAAKMLTEALRFGATVLDFGLLDEKTAYIDACGAKPWFSAQFTFDSAAIEWDGLFKKAWFADDLGHGV